MKTLTLTHAMRESKALCKVLGPGWEPKPFKWIDRWVPRAKCGERVSLYPEEGSKRHDRYFAYFGAISHLMERGATPRSTAKKLLARMKAMSEMISSDIETMQKRA